nr:MAG TPA: hypothetical protein [Caudoviricetes sp.]
MPFSSVLSFPNIRILHLPLRHSHDVALFFCKPFHRLHGYR